MNTAVIFILFCCFLSMCGLLWWWIMKKPEKATTTTPPPNNNTTAPPPPPADATEETIDLNRPSSSLLPIPEKMIDPYYPSERSFKLSSTKGMYCVLWYGPKTTIGDLRRKQLVSNIDKWYQEYHDIMGYHMNRTVDEQYTNLYKFNVYLHNSGTGGFPDDTRNYLSKYGSNTPGTFKNLHFIVCDENSAAHELAHLVQLRTGGFRNNKDVGWGWESNAQYLSNQVNPHRLYGQETFTQTGFFKRMDTFKDYQQYKSWLWWLSLEISYGKTFTGRMWRDVKQDVPQFEEAARLATQGNVPDMFAEYVRNMVLNTFKQENVRSWVAKLAVNSLSKIEQRADGTLVFEPTTQRLEVFAFDLFNLLPRNKPYKVRVVPKSDNPPTTEAWRVVLAIGTQATIFGANELSADAIPAQASSRLAVTCATREALPPLCEFSVHLVPH